MRLTQYRCLWSMVDEMNEICLSKRPDGGDGTLPPGLTSSRNGDSMPQADTPSNTPDVNDRVHHNPVSAIILDGEERYRHACEHAILLTAMIRLRVVEELSDFEHGAFRTFAGDTGERLNGLLEFHDQLCEALRSAREGA